MTPNDSPISNKGIAKVKGWLHFTAECNTFTDICNTISDLSVYVEYIQECKNATKVSVRHIGK